MELSKCKHNPKWPDTSKVRVLFEEINFIALFVGVAANQNVVVQNQWHFLSKHVKLHLPRRHPALAESLITYFWPLNDQDCSDSPPPNDQQFPYEPRLPIVKGERSHTIAKNFGVPFLEIYTRTILVNDFNHSSKLCLSNKSMIRRIKVKVNAFGLEGTVRERKLAIEVLQSLTENTKFCGHYGILPEISCGWI